MKRLKAALIGLAGVGGDYLSALQADDLFEVVAVADRDAALLRQCTEGTSLRQYADYRSLIVEMGHAGLDALFVAAESFRSFEYMEAAAERGIAVFHKAPPARNVDEARRLAEWFSGKGRSFVVPRLWQCDPAFACLIDPAEPIGRVCTAVAEVRTTAGSQGWRGDSVRAGGGVLLNSAYEQVDMLVALLGVPESVYAQCGATALPGTARNYDTEDTMLVSLRFAGDRIASVAAWRGAPAPHSRVALIGTQGLAEVFPDRLELALAGGATESNVVRTVPPVAGAVHAFGVARLAEDPPEDQPDDGCLARPAATPAPKLEVEDYVATMAVIEAAYLAAKTDEPESPSRWL